MADIARHVMGCHLTQETKVFMCSLDDVAIEISARPKGARRGWMTWKTVCIPPHR